jgi:hypothetical protein
MERRILTVFLIALVYSYSFSQSKDIKLLSSSADAKLKAGNYEEALDDYLQLLSLDNKNENCNYNVAVCYLNTNINKAKAIPYLEVAARSEKRNPNADYLLGRAYQYANRFDDAIAAFEKFKKNAKGSEENLKEADQQIQHCINAKEIIKYPIDVIFQNLGKKINSPFSDYYPFVTENESFMIFNSKRPFDKNALKGENGQFLNNIYISKVVNGEYAECDLIGEPLSKANSGTEVIGMNSQGNTVLLSKTNLRGEKKLYASNINSKGEFSKPEELPSTINGSADVIAATINTDGNTIYFASNRKGGFGGTDIYSCNKLPNGKWSEARNMGPDINSSLDEDFPNLSPDNKTLYFSSKGHSSMGGYDIFKTTFNETTGKFENVKNLGYPINTSYDDMNFRISKNGRYGYVASVRGGGLGDYDIYRVSFNEVEMDYTVVIGQISSADATQKVDYRNSFITVNDNITNELVGSYLCNPANGRIIIILPPGKYSVEIESPGYEDQKYPIEIYDKATYQSELILNFTLTKKK